MSKIRVVDACMGRGKTSAAAAYMSSCKGSKRFLYITPFLDEVDRICSMCDFTQPGSDRSTKLSELKALMHQRKNIASTHALFYLLDDEALNLIRENEYCIIIDESIDTVHRENITTRDFEMMQDNLISVDEDGKVEWIDDSYEGKFSDYKLMAQSGSLYVRDHALLSVMNPEFLDSFSEVIMMTYMFDGQYQKAYLEYFGFEYQMCGVMVDDSDEDNIKFFFTEEPDSPPAKDYHSLISVVDDDRLNSIGDNYFALSKSWFDRRGKDCAEIKKLRSNLNTFFRRRCGAKVRDTLWTCFKGHYEKLIPKDGRFRSGFVSLTSRATNKYKDRTNVAYIANRFIDPNVLKFFMDKGIEIDCDHFALSEMLQFIWRSAIRDDMPITVYIPSKRMRDLFIKWIDERNIGG